MEDEEQSSNKMPLHMFGFQGVRQVQVYTVYRTIIQVCCLFSSTRWCFLLNPDSVVLYIRSTSTINSTISSTLLYRLY